jgi:uncharacterized protein (TIGR03437 family)
MLPTTGGAPNATLLTLTGYIRPMITANAFLYPDGDTGWEAASQGYTGFSAAMDTEFAMEGCPDCFTPGQIRGVADTYVSYASGGNIPGAVNLAGGRFFYGGCETTHYTPTLDGLAVIPIYWLYYQMTSNLSAFAASKSVLLSAVNNVMLDGATGLVTVPNAMPYTVWGFHDGVAMTGLNLQGSLFYYGYMRIMAFFLTATGDAANAAIMTTRANKIQANLSASSSLWNATDGMFYAATLQDKQDDILGSAYAVWLNSQYPGFLASAQATDIGNYLNTNYSTITLNGYVRQSPADWSYYFGVSSGGPCGYPAGDYDDAWWSVGNSWVAYALLQVSASKAEQFVTDFLNTPTPTLEWIGGLGGAHGNTGNLESPAGTLGFVSSQPALYPATAEPVISGVQDAESARTSIVPGEWVAIYGQNLAGITRTWTASDFDGTNNLPTSLSGVSVRFNGIPAAIYYISPNLLDVQAPSGISGDTPVTVSDNGAVSAPFVVTVVPSAPSLFYYVAGSDFYPAATHADGTLIGDPALTPGSSNASPGETIVLYVNGLAASPGGIIISTPEEYSMGVAVTIGATSPTAIPYAGLVAAGEYQINVTLPGTLAPGKYPIAVSTPQSGVVTPLQVILPVQ